ncbi:MAG: 50S ribosomal protein L32 [Alphaproteobacteria bacterium]|nr:MAG: 50S ribosomal protein L32 [Alphaproteobacteria bacterium]TAF76702.1 MAG: 50S ribosomal protein L32 [Alphaproteobacteria bacterium]
MNHQYEQQSDQLPASHQIIGCSENHNPQVRHRVCWHCNFLVV